MARDTDDVRRERTEKRERALSTTTERAGGSKRLKQGSGSEPSDEEVSETGGRGRRKGKGKGKNTRGGVKVRGRGGARGGTKGGSGKGDQQDEAPASIKPTTKK